ncbi:MAG: Fe-S cluster assembly protein SufD [Microthrixaceae bacterium]|nr:Fe-S cluster assembly protein SufD [Microthrixaceae bacterium]
MPADALTPTFAESIPGPAWLSAQRLAAAQRYERGEAPTAEREEWRYSRIGDVDVSKYALHDTPTEVAVSSVDLGPFAGRALLRNGQVVAVAIDDALAAKGVVVASARTLTEPLGFDLPEPVGGPDSFDDLNAGFAPDPLVIIVPRGVVVDAPIHIEHHVDAADALIVPRTIVSVGENASLRLVEWVGSEAVDALVVDRTVLHLDNAARVTRVSVNNLATSVTHLAGVCTSVGQQAELTMDHVALGGAYARNRFDCRLVGRGASGRISALYLGAGDQMHDLRTFQSHEARDTMSDLVFKGAVDDRAHAVYTGLIQVGEEAAGTNANQSNRVITLSEHAWAESVPNLEIHHNDVKCSHATAVGPIDVEQRFYLESRGVPPEAAERLVVNGFFAEVLGSIADERVVDLVAPLIADKLAGSR